MRKISLILLLFTIITFGSIRAFAQYFPETANLAEVTNRVEPNLISSLKRQNLTYGSRVFLRIYKQSSILEVWVMGKGKYKLFKTYKICKYSGNLGPKQKEGDMQAPEGIYWVTKNQLNPNSDYHLSFDLGYPNRYDTFYRRTGSFLMVHGKCVSIGCYAITDPNIEELYLLMNKAFENGQDSVQIHILPFKPTIENFRANSGNQWAPFWRELAKIDLAFEKGFIVPKVGVKDGHYILTE